MIAKTSRNNNSITELTVEEAPREEKPKEPIEEQEEKKTIGTPETLKKTLVEKLNEEINRCFR